MAGPVPAIHVERHMRNDVDARDKPGHDEHEISVIATHKKFAGKWIDMRIHSRGASTPE